MIMFILGFYNPSNGMVKKVSPRLCEITSMAKYFLPGTSLFYHLFTYLAYDGGLEILCSQEVNQLNIYISYIT